MRRKNQNFPDKMYEKLLSEGPFPTLFFRLTTIKRKAERKYV